VSIELSAKLGILHLVQRYESEFGGDDEGKSWLVWEIDGGILKSIDSGYAS